MTLLVSGTHLQPQRAIWDRHPAGVWNGPIGTQPIRRRHIMPGHGLADSCGKNSSVVIVEIQAVETDLEPSSRSRDTSEGIEEEMKPRFLEVITMSNDGWTARSDAIGASERVPSTRCRIGTDFT
jgi:hypothetical protein